MSARLKALRRIVEVQRDLRSVAEWRRAEIERRLAALEAAERDLVRFLSDGHAFAGLFATSLAGRLRALAAEIEQARRSLQAQAEIVQREARRERGAERLAGRVAQEEARAQERRELLAVIEAAAARGGASPP